MCLVLLNFPAPSNGLEDPLEKGKPAHSSILAWTVPWTEEPGVLQSMGSQRVLHASRVQSTVSHFKTERGSFLETP